MWKPACSSTGPSCAATWWDGMFSLPPCGYVLPGHAELQLCADSTYSYHSNLGYNYTTDTAGIWRLNVDRHDSPTTYLVASFSPAKPSRLGLTGVTEANQVRLYGGYKTDSGQYSGQPHRFALTWAVTLP